jgi:RNA polymerase sigma-70 factor (ECF subfamily)
MMTAKNCALDALRRERTARTFAPELGRLLESEWTTASIVEELFMPNEIKDDQLRVMFSCCHPRLPEESQVALILHILCGFSVGEIASAFVSGNAAMEKRITRAKKALAGSKRLFDVTAPADFAARLPAVRQALYLLFNEGYHGASSEAAIRSELCREAMRLAALLLAHPLGAAPATYALAALMCLHAARLPARADRTGNLTTLAAQDRSLWDRELISEGLKLLELSATGSDLSEFHIESAIAAVHATVNLVNDTQLEFACELLTLETHKRRPISSGNTSSKGHDSFVSSRIRRSKGLMETLRSTRHCLVAIKCHAIARLLPFPRPSTSWRSVTPSVR